MLSRGLLLMLAVSGIAHADRVSDLVARGEGLAKQSEYSQAIAAFKEADAITPRAAHACMIGLAYMRRELWPQAELFFARCEKRATASDPAPEWLDAAHQQLAQKLAAAQIPAITIEVVPATPGTQLTVSSFEPDEQFDPQTIHLAPGRHVIDVVAPGHHALSREIQVQRAEPQTLRFELPTESVPRPPSAVDRRSIVPWLVIGAGAALAIGGVAYDLAELQPARDLLDQAQTGHVYDLAVGDFRTKRNITVGLFAAGAVAIGAGVALRLMVFRGAPEVTTQIARDGAVVVVGWQR